MASVLAILLVTSGVLVVMALQPGTPAVALGPTGHDSTNVAAGASQDQGEPTSAVGGITGPERTPASGGPSPADTPGDQPGTGGGATDVPRATEGSPGTQGPTETGAAGATAPPPSGSPEPPPAFVMPPEELTGYHWPIRNGRVTYWFAPRDDGFLVVDGKRIHEGLDISTFCGDQVRAAHDGTVLAAGRHFLNVYGYSEPMDDFYARLEKNGRMDWLPIVVVIDDGNGYRSSYVHLGVTHMKVGDHVQAGQIIGYEGATGNASGCHLHYELFQTDGPWMRIAPERVHQDHYPSAEWERIDPMRVLSLKERWAARPTPGVDPPKVSPGLDHPSVVLHHRR